MTTSHARRTWRLALGTIAAGLLAVGTALAPASVGAVPSTDVGSWSASPVAGATTATCPAGDGGLDGQTVRDIVYPSVSGNRVRIRLSNVFGTSPLVIGAASIAVQTTGASTLGSRPTALRFDGRRTTTIPPGAEIVSDWADRAVVREKTLAVSVYAPSFDGPATFHPLAVQDSFLSGPGDFAGSQRAADYPTTISCWLFLDGIDVQPPTRVAGTVVAFGDSITDGFQSGKNANERWPNILGRRLADRRGRTLSVVDEGISGNRLLSDAGTAGVSALARFNRDALGQTGVRDVIVLEGINDIGVSYLGVGPKVTARDLEAADRQLIAKAHAHGVKIFGGTLTPYKGAGYWDPTGERIREQLNTWIRTSGEFDGVIDFAAATANPDDPQVFEPKYDSGDHLHPNDAGYEAMAAAIDLGPLLRR